MRRPLSSYHPWLYWLRVQQRRFFRQISWRLGSRNYTNRLIPEQRLEYRFIKHTSKLIRKLGNSDIALQHNKVINLKLATAATSGIVIAPGEYFSFCRLVGKPTEKRGFVEGMELSYGEARQGIGGGICQLSNLIHWMAIHSPLVVVERANHSFDPFPDEGRILPFGSGAAIFYNYIDLVLHNPTQDTFQLIFNVAEHQLEGELLCDKPREVKYHVYQQAHRFVRQGDRVWRQNEIWRDISTKGQEPVILQSECLYRNNVVVKYHVDTQRLNTDLSSA
ncbi:vancomycin resistance protein [Limnobaculum zhutongyuii]|uniref:Vancomycin resistance protein n=1 Tax=Limnobaculum zhutongyuii TaxID=2498113 RepID=A0A411WKD1_9GAMM|nr:VanW family protein [Limnobaculum zhutongyuii]QBH96671.1 vancomycin resistance protein [Limnobaculum zhutongyuii]TQS90297.1 vancomycin resistance protein [Limnobaculum zhutongyuii]